MPDRQQRLERVGSHTNAVSDTILSGILQGSREAIGGVLEGKNRIIKYLGEKWTVSEKKKRHGKTWRFINNELFGRVVKLVNGVVDIAGTTAISTVDVINNTQGSIHDMFTGQHTAKGLVTPLFSGAFNDILWKRTIKDTLWNGFILNGKQIVDGKLTKKDINFDFDASSGRTYGAKDPKKKSPTVISHPSSKPKTKSKTADHSASKPSYRKKRA